MRNLVFSALAAAGLLTAAGLGTAADEKWVTIKGQVVFPADHQPEE
jgi:hypothetical protein